MNKIYGLKSDFTLIKEDVSRVVVSYGLQPDADGEHATWNEIDFYKKQGKPNLAIIREAIKADINAATEQKIIGGFVWNGIKVWLSDENQRNFSEAQRIAASNPEAGLPAEFKLGEDENGDPIYHTFETVEELTGFYLSAVTYIKQQLAAGWAQKDSIDWTEYESALNPPKKRKSAKNAE